MVLSVLVIILLAVILGKSRFIADGVDSGLMRIVVEVLLPCLIFDRIIHTDAFSDPQNIWLPPLLGFLLTAIGIGIGLAVAVFLGSSITGLSSTRAKRTFAASVGILNYGFIPVPLAAALFPNDDRTMGVLFLQYIGSEFSIWTLVIFCLYGYLDKKSLRKLLSVPIIAILTAVPLNMIWHSSILPTELKSILHLFNFIFDGQYGTIHLIGTAAIPMSLFVIGVTISRLIVIENIKLRWHKTWRIAVWSVVIRLFLMPIVILSLVVLLPCTIEIKRVLVLYAAMNSAVITVVLAKYYGGCEKTALDTIMSNTIISIVSIPIWIALGFYLIARFN
jgi:predicted permease